MSAGKAAYEHKPVGVREFITSEDYLGLEAEVTHIYDLNLLIRQIHIRYLPIS